MRCYLDSSVLLRFLLLRDPAFKQTSRFEAVGSSELLLIECSRVLDRYRLEGQLDDSQLAEARQHLRDITGGLYLIEMTAAVKTRAAGSFPTILGTLDAIHLASAALWKEAAASEELLLLTVDRQMRTCAIAMGIAVLS